MMKNLLLYPYPKKIAVLGIICLAALTACEQQNTSPEPIHTDTYSYVEDERFVTETSARLVASHLMFETSPDVEERSAKEVASLLPVPDKNDVAAYYIINYKGGGFAIVAADKRVEPVLAFSSTNPFDTDRPYFPGGLAFWLMDALEHIEKVRNDNDAQSPFNKWQWDNVLGGQRVVESCLQMEKSYYTPSEDQPSEGLPSGLIQREPSTPKPGSPDDPGPRGDHCKYIISKRGPLCKTEWDQEGDGNHPRNYYNAHTPYKGCSNGNGRAPTGCVAVAMAQVMKYHKHPSNYNWSAMPDKSASDAIARLMADVGRKVKMNYGCASSSASTRTKAAKTFRNHFKYKAKTLPYYDYSRMMRELYHSRPVILYGGKKDSKRSIWFITWYEKRHAWIFDGYKRFTDTCWGSTVSLHMNWGWGGSGDGFYGKYHAAYEKLGMVVDIEP